MAEQLTNRDTRPPAMGYAARYSGIGAGGIDDGPVATRAKRSLRTDVAGRWYRSRRIVRAVAGTSARPSHRAIATVVDRRVEARCWQYLQKRHLGFPLLAGFSAPHPDFIRSLPVSKVLSAKPRGALSDPRNTGTLNQPIPASPSISCSRTISINGATANVSKVTPRSTCNAGKHRQHHNETTSSICRLVLTFSVAVVIEGHRCRPARDAALPWCVRCTVHLPAMRQWVWCKRR